MAIKICLDAGHGLHTAGKRTPLYKDGKCIHEAQQNYPIMLKVGTLLLKNGFEVIYTNTDINIDMPLPNRVRVSNNNKADLFVSIHKNAIGSNWNNKVKGIETFVYKAGGTAEKVAKLVHHELIADTKMFDRGVKVANFQVLRETTCPALLLELGFMDNETEASQMLDKVWHNLYATAIVKGICAYYGKSFIKDSVIPTVKPQPTSTPVSKPIVTAQPVINWQETLYKESISKLHDAGIISDLTAYNDKKYNDSIEMWRVLTLLSRFIK